MGMKCLHGYHYLLCNVHFHRLTISAQTRRCSRSFWLFTQARGISNESSVKRRPNFDVSWRNGSCGMIRVGELAIEILEFCGARNIQFQVWIHLEHSSSEKEIRDVMDWLRIVLPNQ
ncbi:unnamed protein product [Albugo candida]|uniref:Uncharacterized protein n=1 Tax=Albugo candida TaxID=65357 RepID=A0A024GUS6_9STRA|nr:unnamed protein product [Albugo candida]|eukprot:CCI50128.1 unnamed protein product [Albugo candida]